MRRKNFENALGYLRGNKTASDINEKDLIELGILKDRIEKMQKVANYMGQTQARAFIKKLAEAGLAPTDANYLGDTEGSQMRKDPSLVETNYEGEELNSDEEKAMALVEDLISKQQIELPDGTGQGEYLQEYDDDEDSYFGDTKEASDLHTILGLI